MAKKPKMTPRKPPKAVAVDQFVRGGGASSSTAGGAGVGPHGGTTTRREVKRGENAGQLEARVTVCLPDDLVKKAKMWCLTNGTTLSAVVEEALRERVGA